MKTILENGAGVIAPTASANLIIDFYDTVRELSRTFEAESAARQQPGTFSPAFRLPDLSQQFRDFYSVAGRSGMTSANIRASR